MSPLSRFLHITNPQYATTTSSLPQLLTDEIDAAPLSSSSIPAPGPSSSTSKLLDAGDSIHPLIPRSAQLNSFYNPPVPQLLAESSQHPERYRRPRTSVTPYFIPESRVFRPPEPTTTTVALVTMQPAMAPTMAPTISQSMPAMTPTTSQSMPITIPAATTSQSMSTTIPTAVQPTAPAPVVINVRPDVRKQIVDRAKRRIVRFILTTSAMAGTDDERARLVSLAISEATSMPGMNVTIRTTSSQRQQVMVAWNNTFRKLLVMSNFRGRVIATLINNNHNPLAFMHKFTVDADGNLTILQGVLDNPLIFHVVVHLIWCSDLGISEFLSATMSHQLQQLDYAIAAVGAVVKLALREQIPHPPVILPFTQLEGSETFNTIVRYIGDLDSVQKIILDHQKSHMLNVGNSQVLSTNVLAQLDMMMAGVQ
ncbi:hypothetical protein DFJ58DRAFT_730094 [Suillus subalutaceus]|uniref:uncharacterized protein n=1 Tax=Suillus subalutaceus TaxID=48586 RepID=UPI001B8685A0|nr:uncharacterized protein DFJ58DRAFT_730094 [Suillus subalutaceus]KAG1847681.1 hypothetical protein DFJ58DRAFT_730094 [Suillus subalutaceus]